MTTKVSKKTEQQLKDKVSDAARNVWLAGLGAYSQVFSYATDRFDDLVAEGRSLEVRVRRTEEETVDEVKGKFEALSAKARNQWTKVEKAFQRQSTKVVNGLGLPSLDDVHDLSSRVARLDKKVRALTATQAHGSKVASAA